MALQVSPLSDDRADLLLLRSICAGRGLSINIADLSRRLHRHRLTVQSRVDELLAHGVIDKPVFPFKGLFSEYPLLVVSYADLPYDDKTIAWVREDGHIFGAYRVREGDSNTVLLEFHRDVWDYHLWRERIVADGKIPERGRRSPSSNYYFSNKSIVKYEPSAGMALIEEEFREKGEVEIGGLKLDAVAVAVLGCLVGGEGMKLNENELAKELHLSRRTILSRIAKLQQEGLILGPLCRFPHFFTPPNRLLILSLVEVRDSMQSILQDILSDPHVSLAYRISEGRYNLLLFECHRSIEGYLRWEDHYSQKYQGCLGSIRISILPPLMTIHIDQQKVSLSLISTRLEELASSNGPPPREPPSRRQP
jgi:DNA-binding Lrp family transcriptional regulator